MKNIAQLKSRLGSLALRIYARSVGYIAESFFAADSMGLCLFISTQRTQTKLLYRLMWCVTVVECHSRSSKLLPIESSDDVYGAYQRDHVIGLHQRRCDANRRLRSVDTTDYAVPITRIKFGERAFCVTGQSTWKSLPEFLRRTDCTETFKRRLKSTFNVYLGSVLF